MALIPLGLGRFADDPDTRLGVNAMRHQNSVFHGLLKHVPWDVFGRLVSEHGADSRVRRLNTKSQFVALLYGQLSGAVSLREIVTGLASHAARLYHLGIRAVQRSTLADANAQRPSAVFTELFAEMVKRAGRGLRRAVGESVYLIDATSLRLSEASLHFSNGWVHRGSASEKIVLSERFVSEAGGSRCRQSVARICSALQRLKGARWWRGSTAGG